MHTQKYSSRGQLTADCEGDVFTDDTSIIVNGCTDVDTAICCSDLRGRTEMKERFEDVAWEVGECCHERAKQDKNKGNEKEEIT